LKFDGIIERLENRGKQTQRPRCLRGKAERG
jgi:hypothetical protein